jgi:hypothetical protein
VKIGSESRTKLYAAVGLMVLALGLVANWIFSSGGGTPSSAAAPPPRVTPQALARNTRAHVTPRDKKAAPPRSLDPTLREDWLAAGEGSHYEGTGRNIFQAQAEIPQPHNNGTTDHVAAAVPTGPPPPPPPPPINLKFYGFASKPGESKKVFLSEGEDIFVASEGDIVDRRYKILHISPTSVEVEDVLNNNRQSIPLSQG